MKKTTNNFNANPLSFETDPDKIAEILKNTANLTVQSRKNFSEKEKQLITPKQTKKNAPRAQVAKVAPVVNLKNLNDPKAKQFVDTCTANYQGRFVEYCRKYRLDPKKVDIKDTGFWSDSHNFIDNLKLNPVQVYRDMIQIANYMSEKNPHGFAMQFANNIAILNESDQFFVAQKELNKFCETAHALASGRRCSDIYVRLFAIAMVRGYRTLEQLEKFYCGLRKDSKLPEDLKKQISEDGGAAYKPGTGYAQSGQSKKVCKFLGLLNYKKRSKNTPIDVFDRALPLFNIIAGLDK